MIGEPHIITIYPREVMHSSLLNWFILYNMTHAYFNFQEMTQIKFMENLKIISNCITITSSSL